MFLCTHLFKRNVLLFVEKTCLSRKVTRCLTAEQSARNYAWIAQYSQLSKNEFQLNVFNVRNQEKNLTFSSSYTEKISYSSLESLMAKLVREVI
jgi:hypothetical protein